jgi:hypothetical protein
MMTQVPGFQAAHLCSACGSAHGVSRRGFLCTGAAAVAAVPALAASVVNTAQAQSTAAPAPGRPLLIKNGCVLSLDRAVGDFERADVLIAGSKIAAVGPNLNASDAEVIDASRAIVMPGFVDTHRHMWEGILRNIIPDSSLWLPMATRPTAGPTSARIRGRNIPTTFAACASSIFPATISC